VAISGGSETIGIKVMEMEVYALTIAVGHSQETSSRSLCDPRPIDKYRWARGTATTCCE